MNKRLIISKLSVKITFFENKAFWHTFAVLCISVFNISAPVDVSIISKISEIAKIANAVTHVHI